MPKRMPRHLVMQPEEVTAPVVGENGGIVYSDKLGQFFIYRGGMD